MDIDTRTDVYALGVLLYELLVGTLPFEPGALRAAGYDEIRRIIREDEPERPSTRFASRTNDAVAIADHRRTTVSALARQLKGELDWIVLKTLEKDRRRRYPAATALAIDIRRYLDDEPVEARPPSGAYRFRKFVRKQRGPVAAALLVLAALIAGVAVSATMYFRAERQREAAVRDRAAAVGASNDATWQRSAAETARLEAERQRAVAERAFETSEAARHDADAQRIESSRHACISYLMSAEASIQSGRSDEGHDWLSRCDTSLRGWEWRYVNHLDGHPLVLKAPRPLSAVSALRVSADGTQVIVDGIAPPSSLQGPRPFVTVTHGLLGNRPSTLQVDAHDIIALSPDGRVAARTSWQAAGRAPRIGSGWDSSSMRLTAVDADGARTEAGHIEIVDRRSGEVIQHIISPDSGISPSISFPNAGVVESIDPLGRIAIDTRSQQLRFPQVMSGTFNEDGSLFACWSWDNIIRVWRIATGSLIATLKGSDIVSSAVFLPGSDLLVSGSYDGALRTWNLSTSRELENFQSAGSAVTALAVSSRKYPLVGAGYYRNQVAAGYSNGLVRLWTGNVGGAVLSGPAKAFDGHTDRVTTLAFSSNGSYLGSGSRDRTLRVWDQGAATPREIWSFRGFANDPVLATFTSNPDRILSVEADGTLRAWSLSERPPANLVPTVGIRTLGFDPRRRALLTIVGGGALLFWDLHNPSALPETVRLTSPTVAAALSRSGAILAGSDDSRLSPGDGVIAALLDVDRRIVLLKGPRGRTDAVAFSADGRSMLTSRVRAGQTGTEMTSLILWNLDGRQLAHVDAPAPTRSIVFSPDGHHVARSSPRGVEIYDAHTLRSIMSIAVDDAGPMKFTPDSRRIVVAASASILLFDAQSGGKLRELAGHSGNVSSVELTPDGQRASHRWDGWNRARVECRNLRSASDAPGRGGGHLARGS